MLTHQSLAFALRVLLFLVGLCILMYTFLVYEDQEQQLQSRIENLWVKLYDRSSLALLREQTVISRLAAVSSSLLDAVFGPALICARSILVSITFSVALAMTFMSALHWSRHPASWKTDAQIMMYTWTFAGLALYFMPASRVLGALLTFALTAWAGVLVLLSLTTHVRGFQGAPYPTPAMGMIVAIFVLIVSICVDVTIVALSRRLLRTASRRRSDVVAIGWLLAMLGFAAVLVYVPLSVASMLRTTRVAAPMFWMFLFNLGDVLALLGISLLLVFLVFHHYLFWPAVLRPLYALQRYRLASIRKSPEQWA